MKKIISVSITMASVLILISCIRDKNTISITFENKSNITIDSAAVCINNFTTFFRVIKPGKSITQVIYRDSIKVNNHSYSIYSNIYSQDTSKTSGGFFYTDLGGSIENEYVVVLNEKLHIEISPQYK
jgi:hypothetical protein